MGENGIIHAADQHTCQECTQPYKRRADIITGDDPAALVGMDENHNVPALNGEDADMAAKSGEQARENAQDIASAIIDEEMDVDDLNDSYTTMTVVDGIVISSPIHTLNFLLLTSANISFSIVLMITALQKLQTPEVDLFVLYMNICMEQNVV